MTGPRLVPDDAPERRVYEPPKLSPPAGLEVVRRTDLKDASFAVLQAWRNDRGDAMDAEDTAQTLLKVAAGVEAAFESGGPPVEALPRTPLARHLLDLLRAELVAAWGRRTPPAPEMVRLLAAAERVRAALEPDWSQHFTSRLSSPDGLDLVVEVAHDLRSPLTSILFLAETLGRGQSGPLTDLQQRQMRLIYSAALGLSSMATDVIELARGGDHLVDQEVASFSIREVVESTCDMVRPIAEEKGLQLRFLTPATDQRLGRSVVLSRVLLNLTTNALKFTDEGYVEITAQAKGRTEVEFAVRDTGPGMSEDALASLYQPFRRTRSRQHRGGYYFSGTGLGLAMCRKLVVAMGGELAFETQPGWGTRFSFKIALPPASQL